MIALIDNKDYMIELCKDSPDIHGFDVSYPGWEGCMKLCSDIGMMVLVSGKEAEDYLDKNHIYYLHIEDEGESYGKFLAKLLDAMEENKDFLESNTSCGKLVYAIDEDLGKGTIDTENVIEIWRYHEDGKYYINVSLIDELREMPSYVLKSVCDTIVDKTIHDLAPDMADPETLSEEMMELERPTEKAEDFEYLFSADTLKEMLVKLAILMKSIFTGEYIEPEEE